ncbi:hypothetical protein HJG60_008637 [Phyllostomus discolor]|uniref:Coiled-coil domain-containing protein n=1 Tax=Phyllostomus discolor TaxID=89673 RepID=A0A834DNM0_9CHIR|nr:hypothetical protein HJG60_008637 [Phyllostomus discolor]
MRQSKELQCNLKTKMKNLQQKRNDAFFDVIHSKLPILPTIKMSSILSVETDVQRMTGFGHIQLMQVKLPNGRKVCCPDSIDVSHLSSSVKDGKQEEEEHKSLPALKNSQGFIFNTYQEENHELVKTDEDLKHPGSINIQGQPQRHFTQTILESASCSIFDQCHFGNPERYARFYPPKSGEAKIDAIFFARECVVPSDANHQEEQTGHTKKKKTVTFDHCMSAFSTSKRKRNIQQCLDMKMLVNPKCRILKAKKPSISYILNIKGGASPNHTKELGCNLTTEMKEVEPGKKMADEMYSFMTITPAINRHNKVEREKDRSGEKRLNSNQVKQVISLHKGNVTSDDTEETNLQGEEEEESEQEMLLKVVPQHGNFFLFSSDQKKELDLHKSENKGSGKTLFVTGQDIPPQMQPTDPLQVQEPRKSHQAQNGTMHTANSKLPLLKSKESLVSQFLTDTGNCGIPNIGNLTGELYSRGEEEMPGFNVNRQAAVLESTGISTPDLSELKRQRKTFPYTALKSKMSSKCVIMKARKTRISQIFNVPGNGCLKNLPLNMLKPMIIDFLVHMEYFEVLEDLSTERKEGLTQELPAMVLESLDLSTLALPTSKRKYLKRIGKRNKMSPKCLTLKAKKALISQTFNITKCGIPRHRRQFKCNFKLIVEESIPVADTTLSVISFAMPISLDINVNDTIKVETDVPWKMRFSHELQQQEQSPDGARTSWANSSDKRGSASNNMNKIKVQGREAALNTPHFSFNTQKTKETHFVNSGLALKNSARKTIPGSFTTVRELQQQAFCTQHVLYSISHSILNLLPFKMLPKTTKTQPRLKDTRSPKVSSPTPGQSVSAPFNVTAQCGIPFDKRPRKELDSSIPEGKVRLQKDLPEFLNFSMPASPNFKGQRNVAQIPKSRTGKAQMVLKSIKITRAGALSHGKQWDDILENMAEEISVGMSNMFLNTSLSSTPVSPSIKMHQKAAKKGPLRKKCKIRRGWKQGERKQNKGERLCTRSRNKRSAPNTTLEFRWRIEDSGILVKAGLPFLNRLGSRKYQDTLIAEQEVQPQTLVSENISASFCSLLMIPFQMEKLKKTIPPQNNILHRTCKKILCPKSAKAVCDNVLIDETEYSTISDGSPVRKLDVRSAVSLQPKEKEEDTNTQKVITHTVDQNTPPPKSGNSVLGDPCDGISRRKAGGHTANKYEELQRDSLTMSMASVLFESKRQEKVLEFPVRKILTGRISGTKKTKKPVCAQMHTITEHSNLYCRREQECNLKSTIKDIQQSKSIVNAFSFPIPFSSESKRHIEMYSIVKTEIDKQLEKSLCYREAQKSNSTDTQKKSSYTVKMNVQQNEKEVRIGMIDFQVPKHQEKETQGSKETQALISLPSLPHLKLDKETQRISNTGEIVQTKPISGDIMKEIQNKKQPMPQKEERDSGKRVAMRGMAHTADTGLKSEKSPPSYTLHRTELYVNIGGQEQNKHEDRGKPPDTVLRKVPISRSPINNLKLDKGTQVDEEELRFKGPPLFPRVVSALSDAEKIEDTETTGDDVRKRKQHLSQEEEDREQNRTKVDKDLLEVTGVSSSQLQLPESSGAVSIQYADSSKDISIWTVITKANQHRPHKDGKGREEIEDGKGGILPKTITLRKETCPLKHPLGRNGLPLMKGRVTDVQKDKSKPEMVLRKTCASLPSLAHPKWVTGMNETEDTLRTTQSCFLPLKIQDSPNAGQKEHTKSFEGHVFTEEDRPSKYFEDNMLPIYTDLKAKKLPLPHILNTKELQCKIKEQKRKVQDNKNKLITNVKNICTSFLTLPYHIFDTTEEEGCRVIVTEVPLPPLQSKASSDAVEIAHAETTDGELSKDVKALKEEKDREKNMNMNRVVDPHDMHLSAKKSPILLVYNLSGLQRKTKKREGKVRKVACEPSGEMRTQTPTSGSSPLHLDMNIRIKDKGVSTFTRSSGSSVNSQESSDSEEVVYGEPITCDILISPQEGKQRVPQNKKEVGVQTISLEFPEHRGKKTQASKGERKAEMQRRKEYGFGTPKETALRNEDDSGIFIRNLSVSVMSPSQTEETIEFEANLEREKRLPLSKFQKKSPNASDTVKRNNSSTVKKGGQDFTNVVPEDSQPFMVDQKQVQELPSVKSEENLSSEVSKRCLTPQTEEGVVPEHISKIVKEPDLLIIEQEEKAPKPILTPTEHPGMSEDPKENAETHIKSTLSVNTSLPGAEEPQHETQPVDTVECASPPEHSDQSEPIQDTIIPKVQGQKTSSGTVLRSPQVKSNEIKIVADSMCAETLPILCEAIRNVFESQIKNMDQDQVYEDILEKMKAHWKSPPFSRAPDTTSTTIHPKLQPKPLLESKALEIKLNLIPKMAKQSFQKFNFYPKRTITEDDNRRLHPRRKNMKFLSLEEIDTIQLNLKHKYQKDSPHISCMKTMIVDVSCGSKEIIAKLNSISKLENGTSLVTPANTTPLSQILQNYSVEEKDKLLIHFSIKTLEIQMKAFPRIVIESRTMANTQHRRKPLCKCIHLGVQVPKYQSNQSNRILLLFEEKSLHQIELDLQCKYLHFLLGLPEQSTFLRPNELPKHFLKSNTVAMCKKAGNSGESGSLSTDPELLELHVSFKKQRPHENSLQFRRFLEPTPVCAPDPEWPGVTQKGTSALPVLKSHVTLEKDKHRVWFQETETRGSFDLKTQENAPSLVDYHSIQISQGFTGSQTHMESSASLEECSAFETHDSEESIFLEANPYLSQESENILFELQKGIPLENFYKIEQIKTDLKPDYSDNSGSLPLRGCRKPSSKVTPLSQESYQDRKCGSSSKVQSPAWRRHSSLNALGVPLGSPSAPFSDEKLPWITKNRTGYSLAPLTESNIKLHLAKSQDKPHRQPESKERKKTIFDLFRRNAPEEDGDHSCPQRLEKHRRKKKVCDGESERTDYFPSKYKSAAKPHQEYISLHSERKQNQPFFYACVPADSLEIIPQTVRWTIPPKTLRKRNFRVPLLAELSSSFSL